MPRKRARRSFSRMAISERPNGEFEQRRHRADADREDRQSEIIERLVVAVDVELSEAEIDRQAMPAGQPVVAAGHRVPAEGDEIEDLAERDRHHREIDAAQLDDQRADDRRRRSSRR